MQTPEESGPSLLCPHCQGVYRPGDSFCGICGKELVLDSSEPFDDVFEPLQPVLWYYFAMLLVLVLFKFTEIFPDGFHGMMAVTALTTLLTLGFCIHSWSTTRQLYSFQGFRFSVLGLTIIGAVIGSFIITVLAEFINASIHDDVFYDTYLFNDTSFPLLLSILIIAVEPAIFEEVAFRGFLFTALNKITKGVNAVYISAFLFGIMHLSVISLLWLVPIGIAFAKLRRRYNTLWYGMAGHFTYNLCIVLYEWFGYLK